MTGAAAGWLLAAEEAEEAEEGGVEFAVNWSAVGL
jgi:orotate phosphoribosyltransferase-like protein